MIVTNRDTGLRPGDSRYPYSFDKCYRVVDTVQRKHSSVEQGKARAPVDLRPGEKWMVDGGDATVRSKWGAIATFFCLFAPSLLTLSSTTSKTIALALIYQRSNTSIVLCVFGKTMA